MVELGLFTCIFNFKSVVYCASIPNLSRVWQDKRNANSRILLMHKGIVYKAPPLHLWHHSGKSWVALAPKKSVPDGLGL